MISGASRFLPGHLFVPAHYVIDSKHRHIHIGIIIINLLSQL